MDVVRRVLKRSPRELATIAHAIGVLVVVEALVRWVSLPRLCAVLGIGLNLDSMHPGQVPLSPSELPIAAGRQLRCARAVTERWPFSKGPCLRRSLVAGHLVRRLRPALRLGVAAPADTFVAHAWLEIDGRPLESVVDYRAFERAPSGRPA